MLTWLNSFSSPWAHWAFHFAPGTYGPTALTVTLGAHVMVPLSTITSSKVGLCLAQGLMGYGQEENMSKKNQKGENEGAKIRYVARSHLPPWGMTEVEHTDHRLFKVPGQGSSPRNDPRVYKHGPKGPVNLHIIHPSQTTSNQGPP